MKINRRIKQLVASSTLAITARAKELRAEGKDVVNFAGGEPDFDTPDSIKDAAYEAIKNGKTKYTPSIGTVQLREAIVDKFKKDNNLNYSLSQIAVSCGAKHSVFNAINVLADEDDEVLFSAPYWVSYPEMVKLSGAKPKIIETSVASNFKITKDSLSKNITEKTRLLILNSPSNPTGVVYGKSELEDIAEICVKNDIYVISDEIYEKLIFDIPEYTSIASLGKDIYDRTITINGVSKTYSMTGWRIGYSAGPEEVIGYIKKFQDHSTSNPSSISQAAAIQALNSPAQMIADMRDKFKERRDCLMSLIDDIPEINYICPQGAFYLFCDISQLGDSMEVAKNILNDVHVAIIPGDGFGAPGYARFSYATSLEKIQDGIKRISDWIKK